MPFHLYVLITWTTKNRVWAIDQGGAAFLKRFLPVVASRNGADILGVGVVADHVHVLLRLGPVIDIPRLVQGLKGASSRVANRDKMNVQRVRWANGYDVRSVSPSGVENALHYVLNQASRHPDRVPRPSPSQGADMRPLRAHGPSPRS